MAKKPTLESIDVALARWKSKLKRSVTAIDKLEKQKKRLLNPRPRGSVDLANFNETFGPAIRENAEDAGLIAKARPELVQLETPKPEPADLGIPEFLRRQDRPNPEAEQIKKEQAETKRKKTRGRIEKMKAKQRGDLKKMPLSGKAALDHIRNG